MIMLYFLIRARGKEVDEEQETHITRERERKTTSARDV